MARIMLGVSGGIAAYKACELTRLLVRAGHDVTPLLTRGAERFVTAETFRALARVPAERAAEPYPHLARAELLVIAPATANTLAKLAHGLADNLVTEAALAHVGPLLVAPAMNVRMWEHPATQANLALLRQRGVEVVGPDEGELAEGEWGAGRMAEADAIAARCEELLAAGTTSPDVRSGCAASACSSVRGGPGSHLTPYASSATAHPGAWASRSPRRRGAAVPT